MSDMVGKLKTIFFSSNCGSINVSYPLPDVDSSTTAPSTISVTAGISRGMGPANVDCPVHQQVGRNVQVQVSPTFPSLSDQTIASPAATVFWAIQTPVIGTANLYLTFVTVIVT